MTARARRAWAWGGAAAIAVAALALWLSREEALVVEAVAAERGSVEQTATNSRAGTVAAHRRAKLSPEQGGRVVALPHREGERVAAGDVLLALDAALERGEEALRRRELEAAGAEAERACLVAELAERELARNRRLAADELVAAGLLDRVDSSSREAAAGCAAARAARGAAASALELALRALEKRTLAAPFDGVVAEISIEVGEWTTPSPPALPVPPVVDVYDPTSIFVSLPMDEVDAARLRPGLPARVTVDSHPGRELAGRVARVAIYVLDIEAQNRTVEIEVELDDAELAATLLPGTSADAEVVLDVRDDVLRVPAPAVLAGDRLLVVDGERLVEREIEVGLRNWDYVEVRSGLAAGERVVVSLDRPEIRAGARVRAASAAEP